MRADNGFDHGLNGLEGAMVAYHVTISVRMPDGGWRKLEELAEVHFEPGDAGVVDVEAMKRVLVGVDISRRLELTWAQQMALATGKNVKLFEAVPKGARVLIERLVFEGIRDWEGLRQCIVEQDVLRGGRGRGLRRRRN